MRPIDADALTASLKESADRCRDWIQECINIKDDVTQRVAEQSLLTFTECYLRVEKIPTIEPQRMRGKWIYGEDEYGIDGYHCNKCGFFVPWDYVHNFINYIDDYNFCPNCGAKMGEQDET